MSLLNLYKYGASKTLRRFLLAVLLAAFVSCGRPYSDPYGKGMPPGEDPAGDSLGNLSPVLSPQEAEISLDSDFQGFTPMTLSPGG